MLTQTIGKMLKMDADTHFSDQENGGKKFCGLSPPQMYSLLEFNLLKRYCNSSPISAEGLTSSSANKGKAEIVAM